MTGFNRRHYPAARTQKKQIDEPGLSAVRINRICAGFISKESPLQDDTSRKGRTRDEVCQCVDTIKYLSGAAPVFVTGAGFKGGQYQSSDNAQINLTLSGGWIAALVYAAAGGFGLAKN